MQVLERRVARPTKDVFSEANLGILAQVYSGGSLDVFRYAADEARRLGHREIQGVHLLLGLIQQGALRSAGGDPNLLWNARLAVIETIGQTPRLVGDIRLGESAKRVFNLAKQQAQDDKPFRIPPEFILKGLLLSDRPHSGVARILVRLGIDRDRLLGRVNKGLEESKGTAYTIYGSHVSVQRPAFV